MRIRISRCRWTKSLSARHNRSRAIVVAVVLLHTALVGMAFVLMQGCRATTPQPAAVEPPPTPVMPPRAAPGEQVEKGPAFQPPKPVAPAPSMREPVDIEWYTIKRGDSLSKIANRFGVSTRELIELNDIQNPDVILEGQQILLPSHARAGGSTSAPAGRPSETVPAEGATYTVQKGDVLSRIAVRHGTTVSAIKQANNLNSDTILVGQRLVIPGARSSSAAPVREELPALPPPAPAADEPEALEWPSAPSGGSPAEAANIDELDEQPLDYTVLEGDTLDEIAKLFIVSKEDIIELNNLSADGTLTPGQKLLIPPPDL